MKKAIDYFKEACEEFDSSRGLYDEPFFVAAIKRAQLDAIEVTVLKCSQEAKIDIIRSWEGIDNGWVNKVVVDEQSLIDIEEQLKKELE